ncbi:MAG: ABC transporter substrate-binding protein [Pseudoflavonifractor capillosus]|uniref:ABC transporter substrate-binding protein n=1 Tax=Pseudoflavonifractor capillosus TaxID=106588 RepID=UPI0023FA297B|nr:ABC transporter substrate-binding protein [Pseudoflavonifractor capillosus]MCI5927754.1 ABC transporter substrate-binding protein [Pseudoflavonifractor capillosus]MDY4662363.1 ABC transporter substrate-binding protein [Pseudoflavonifractor capillosus]
MKKTLALLLALVMALSLCACAGVADGDKDGEATKSDKIADSNNDGQIEVGTVEDVEVNEASEHLDAAEASATGNWEALFVPIDIEGRAIDMADFDLTPTEEELEAMKQEPAYGRPIRYFMSDGCTSGPTMADHLGYYEQAGLTAEGVKGSSDVEALGTDQVDVATGMMAKMLVPITNGVDITFTGGAHIGCKSLYVLADSEYNTTADLKGQKISAPNGIGKSDYNIVALLLDADGINYATDVEVVQVSADACVTAMESGEIAAALLSDTFAYSMVKDGKLKCIRSQLDSDFADRTCCVIAMNGKFVKENPTIAKKVTQAVQKAHSWMRDNSAEATQVLMDMGWNGGNYEMNIMINGSLQFGLSDEFTGDTLKDFIGRYIRLGLITSMDNVDEVLELAWTPLL